MIPCFFSSSKTGLVFCRISAQKSVVFPGVMRSKITRVTGPSVKFSCATSGSAPRIKRDSRKSTDVRRIAVLLCARSTPIVDWASGFLSQPHDLHHCDLFTPLQASSVWAHFPYALAARLADNEVLPRRRGLEQCVEFFQRGHCLSSFIA